MQQSVPALIRLDTDLHVGRDVVHLGNRIGNCPQCRSGLPLNLRCVTCSNRKNSENRHREPRQNLGEPELNEIRSAQEIGKTGTSSYIWAACVDCRKLRGWVLATAGQPQKPRCIRCGRKQAGLTLSIDLTGQTRGQWQVLRKAERPDYYVCKCSCGTERDVLKTTLFTAKDNRGCGGPAHRKNGPGVQARKKVLDNYKRNAKVRNLSWELTDDEFDQIVGQNCAYCGLPPANVRSGKWRGNDYGDFIYSGIDRMDNTKGYIPGNVAPCCWDCNKIKMTMTYDEWMTWTAQLTGYQSKLPTISPAEMSDPCATLGIAS